MLRNPHTLKELTIKIRSSFESEKEITLSSLQNLPYLNAVINETLRMHYPMPINLPRVIVPEGQIIDGESIPGNVRALLPALGL